jgi:hypothetical protein
LGYIALEQGNYREARLYLEKSLSIFRLEKLAVTSLLDQFAWLEHAEGNHKKSAILCASLAALINADISSAILCGTIKGLLTANKYSGISTLGLTYFSKLPELLCEILGIEAFNAAWEEGYAMSMEEGIALALSAVS